MKDMLILAIVVVLALSALRRPWVGLIGWTVISLASPHAHFGFAAASWPIAMGVGGCTLVGMLMTRDRQNPLAGAPTWWLLAFTLWISMALPNSIFFEESLPLWMRSMKIFLMTFVALTLLTDRPKLDAFIWANVASIGFYGVKGGIFTIATGGSYRVWGPGGFIEGNNEVALAVICAMPLVRYLQTQMTNRKISLAMTLAIGLCAITALGTYSRGALLGLAAMGAFFWIKGRNKVTWGFLMVAVGLAGVSLMPKEWFARMDTIQTYGEDSSAMGRINAWWTAFHVAQDHFFGGGFMIWEKSVFARYAPIPEDVHAAHSIYFQVMGEQGFIGLFLFLCIGVSTWWTARRLIQAGKTDPAQRWAADLGAMIQVSMIGYGVTGAFLSLAYYDLPYNVMVIAVVALRQVRKQQTSPAGAPAAAMPSPARPAAMATAPRR